VVHADPDIVRTDNLQMASLLIQYLQKIAAGGLNSISFDGV